MSSLSKRKVDTETPSRTAERRSATYNVVGGVLVAGIVAAFAVFIVRYYFQSTQWKDYFYKNALVFAENCSARFAGSESPVFPTFLQTQAFKPIARLPHPRGFFESWRPAGMPAPSHNHAEYQCVVPMDQLRIGKGANYMHLGWLFGDDITVDINGRRVLHLRGEDFVSFPLTRDDLIRAEILVTVRVSASDGHRFGFASLLPPAITTETKSHLNVFAIQPVFEVNHTVLPLMPTMCLGMLMAFAWVLGIRSRVVLAGLYYFVADLADGLLLLTGPFLPLSATKVHTLGLPLGYLTEAAVLFLLFEVTGLFRARIYSFMNWAVALSAAGFLTLLAWDGVFPYSQLVAKVCDTMLCGFLIIFAARAWHLRTSEPLREKRRLVTAAMCLAAVLALRYGHDVSRHFFWASQINLSFYFSFGLPLCLSGLVLYQLSAVERVLRQVTVEKESMNRRLSVKEELVAVMRAGSSPSGTLQTVAARILWPEESGGAWRVAWETDTGETLLMQGEIIGSVEHAEIGIAALTPVLVGWREQRRGGLADCFSDLNKMMYRIFRGYVRSSAVGFWITPRGEVEVLIAAATGATPALIVGEKAIEARRSSGPLGSHSSCEPARISLKLAPGDKMQLTFDAASAPAALSEITLAG